MELLGPYVFEGNVSGGSCLAILNNFILPHLNENLHNQLENGMFQRLWWMQDEARAHKRLVERQRLEQVFGNRVVALYHDVE